MTAAVAGPRLIVLGEYLCAFADEPIGERLECWELSGPRYSLSVTQYASPDGDGDEAWSSDEVPDPDALWRLLEDWSAARRIGEPTVSEARSALEHALSYGPRFASRHRAIGESSKSTERGFGTP